MQFSLEGDNFYRTELFTQSASHTVNMLKMQAVILLFKLKRISWAYVGAGAT